MRKREVLARICTRSGFTRFLEALPRQNGLLILNYHRIGNPGETPYDPGTFGPTAEEFDWQLGFLKRRLEFVGLEEALAMVSGQARLRPSLLLTFDDGYLDNYQLAFPLLRSHGAQAVFFLPTSFIGTNRVPWWDAIAYIVKHSRRDIIRLQRPVAAELRLGGDGPEATILAILGMCLRAHTTDYTPLIEDLEIACDCQRPGDSAERCFMDWSEAREMQKGGMAFGSHTHRHEILGGLTPAEQLAELQVSRQILERELGNRVDALSYPVGLPYTFTQDTLAAMEESGYRAGFSFYGGLNKGDSCNHFDIKRCVLPDHRDHFRMSLAARTLFNRAF